MLQRRDRTPLRTALEVMLIATSIGAAVSFAGRDAGATAITSGGFTTSAKVTPVIVARNETVTLSIAVTSSSTRAALVDLEMVDATHQVLHTFWDNQAFAATQRRVFTTTWKVPANQPLGVYTVKVGVFKPGWGVIYHWNNAAASLTVTAGTTTTTTKPPTTAPPTTTKPPTTTSPGTSTTAPGTTTPAVNGCLANAAFCETFDTPHNGGTRTGDLDPVLWGVSRVGDINPGSIINGVSNVSMTGCGTSAMSLAPNDVRICNGQLYEAVNDGGGVANLDMYPKQPFNFANRTGKVVFDVSANSDGSHGAWPEFMITDKPVPGARASISAQVPAGAANSIGFALDGGCGINGMTGVGTIFMTKNNVYSEPAFTTPNCTTKGSAAKMNHFEVRVSQNHLEVWGTDAGSTALKQLAVADGIGLTFTQGLVWVDDVHYNARKAVEPCQCGTQFNHTFVWDNVGFDGPKTYRDLGFDVPDAHVVGGHSPAGDPTIQTGFQIGAGPVKLTVSAVRHDQAPTGAQVVLNSYSFATVVPSVSINGGPWIDTPWPYDGQTFSWRSLSIPIPLAQVHDGTNTITMKSGHGSTTVANVSLILVAASPVP